MCQASAGATAKRQQSVYKALSPCQTWTRCASGRGDVIDIRSGYRFVFNPKTPPHCRKLLQRSCPWCKYNQHPHPKNVRETRFHHGSALPHQSCNRRLTSRRETCSQSLCVAKRGVPLSPAPPHSRPKPRPPHRARPSSPPRTSPPCPSPQRPPRPSSPSTWHARPGRSPPRRPVRPPPPPSRRRQSPPRRPCRTSRRARRSTPASPRRVRRGRRGFVHAWRAPSFSRGRANACDLARACLMRFGCSSLPRPLHGNLACHCSSLLCRNVETASLALVLLERLRLTVSS